MQGLSRADHRTLRTAVIEQVLGTDMKKHFNILSRFQVSPYILSDHHAVWSVYQPGTDEQQRQNWQLGLALLCAGLSISSEVLCMLESTCFFLRGGNCLQNLYQRSTTTTGRSGSRELKEVNFTLLLMRSDAAFEVYSSSRSSRTTEAAVLAFTSLSSSCMFFFSAE